ncbi:lipopolysaccharide biosynthesis protein [Flavisphingomonas formosensis]|uniref:lipopolysaccharide biosynthesis protein n=1 Tax=Flavisphingomonas formosensis TaxID=861534 RepID=UPI001E4E4505|nr:lipopolysaccharide biosynthesis protein [Sphingomonas formosensis]
MRSAVFWRSGSQIAAQMVMWASTFLVIRLLSPSDYGLFAMTQVVIAFMNLANGYSFAGALVQAERIDENRVRQVFGMLILMNFGLAALQFMMAPAAAAYFRTPAVEAMLRVQCLLHLATPFIVLPQALLSRTIDFRTQARVNMASAALAAISAPACAFAGLGVWTLVIAPLVLFWTRAIGLALVGRWLVWPSFRFSGARATFGFGSAMLVSELLWFVQTQADVFIAGRSMAPHPLGLYTESLFLTQILLNKFIPALNDVAFPTYARIQADRRAVAYGFATSIRLIMLVALPFYLGLAVTAEPLVLTVMGPKWVETVPLVRLLALAMPFATLQVLYGPATTALGRPGVTAWVSAGGAVIMPIAFLIGVRYGPVGMASAWLIGAPLLLIIGSALSLPIIGLSPAEMFRAARPSLVAALAMAAGVIGLDHVLLLQLPPMPAPLRLLILSASGAAAYGLLLFFFARPLIEEVLRLLRRRAPA